MKSSGIGFRPLPPLSELNPRILAFGFKVLILTRELETERTIQLPNGKTTTMPLVKVAGGDMERTEDAGSEGMVVSMGLQAGYERWPKTADGQPDYAAGHPGVGDVVLFARYSGKHAEFTGADGRTYRMMNDEDVLGLREDMRPAALVGDPAPGAGALAGPLKATPRAKKAKPRRETADA